MENASKALLIAGSVLIVILLIAMGVRVFNSTQGTTDSVEGTMQTTEVTIFNNQFNKYCGSSKSSNDVKNLLNQVIVNNAKSNHKVTVVSSKLNINANSATVLSGAMATAESYSSYNIKVIKVDSDGYITNIQLDDPPENSAYDIF